MIGNLTSTYRNEYTTGGTTIQAKKSSVYMPKSPSLEAEEYRKDQVTSRHHFDSIDLDFALIMAYNYHPHGLKTTFSGMLQETMQARPPAG